MDTNKENLISDSIEKAIRKFNITNSKGKIVRHFKGDYYLIKDIANHTETDEQLVIYVALYEDCKVYARPIDMFIEKVPEGKPNPTGQKFRFELVEVSSVKNIDRKEDKDGI